MTRRFYANAAPQRTLSTAITSGATSLTVSGTFAGWPISFPYFAGLEIGTANAEIVLVTAVVGSVATITRAQDGTAAVAHSGGATLDQVVIAKDFDEANAHINTGAAVHGLAGSVVGTTDVQTLTNKTLTNPVINAMTIQPAVQTYTPVLTAASVNPTLGNSTLTGKYVRFGAMVQFEIDLTIGSTFVTGTGEYYFTLPFATASAAPSVAGQAVATNSDYPFFAVTNSSSGTGGVRLVETTTTAVSLDNTGPYAHAWGAGNILRIVGSYFIL